MPETIDLINAQGNVIEGFEHNGCYAHFNRIDPTTWKATTKIHIHGGTTNLWLSTKWFDICQRLFKPGLVIDRNTDGFTIDASFKADEIMVFLTLIREPYYNRTFAYRDYLKSYDYVKSKKWSGYLNPSAEIYQSDHFYVLMACTGFTTIDGCVSPLIMDRHMAVPYLFMNDGDYSKLRNTSLFNPIKHYFNGVQQPMKAQLGYKTGYSTLWKSKPIVGAEPLSKDIIIRYGEVDVGSYLKGWLIGNKGAAVNVRFTELVDAMNGLLINKY